jgi:hypothetical protein
MTQAIHQYQNIDTHFHISIPVSVFKCQTDISFWCVPLVHNHSCWCNYLVLFTVNVTELSDSGRTEL